MHTDSSTPGENTQSSFMIDSLETRVLACSIIAKHLKYQFSRFQGKNQKQN